MYISVNNRSASMYARVAADTVVSNASPHHLVTMLFEGLMTNLNLARGAIHRKDIPAKGVYIGKCIRIIEEGLKAGLNLKDGGDIAQNLLRIYDFCVRRLMEANVKSDAAILTEVADATAPLLESWKEIGTKVAQPV